MKKILLLITICILSLTGCTTYTEMGYVDTTPNYHVYYTNYRTYPYRSLGNLYYHTPKHHHHKHHYTHSKKHKSPPRPPKRDHKSKRNENKRR